MRGVSLIKHFRENDLTLGSREIARDPSERSVIARPQRESILPIRRLSALIPCCSREASLARWNSRARARARFSFGFEDGIKRPRRGIKVATSVA